MNKDETSDTLAILMAVYPNSFKHIKTEIDQNILIDLWARVFKDWSYIDVSNAVDSIISTNTSGFAPAPGLVMERLIKNTSAPEMTEMEAWQLVFKAVKNSAWHSQEEFAKLPPVLQSSVGSPEMLQSWAGMDAETVNSVIQSNFMRTFRSRTVQDREYKALPGSVQDQIKQLSDGFGKYNPHTDPRNEGFYD